MNQVPIFALGVTVDFYGEDVCVCVCFTRDFLYLSKVYLSKHSKFRNCPLGPKRLSLTVRIDDGNLDLSSAYAP